jgi:hypothetical protein
MSKAKKIKQIRLKPFEKLLTVMISGKPVTKDEIETTLGGEIYMYRLSTYIWHIKTHANGVVKAIKDGRKVTAYQLMNIADVKQYMSRLGITIIGFTPKVKVLDDIKTTEVEAPAVKTPVDEEMEVLEIEVQDPA